MTKHLVTAFVAFGREFEGEQEDDRFRDLVDTAKTALITALNPEDESSTVPRKIEDITPGRSVTMSKSRKLSQRRSRLK